MALTRGQRYAWYTGVVVEPAAWLSYASRRPAVLVTDGDLPILAATNPTDLVLVGRLECSGDQARTVYAFEPVAGLTGPDGASTCP